MKQTIQFPILEALFGMWCFFFLRWNMTQKPDKPTQLFQKFNKHMKNFALTMNKKKLKSQHL